MVEDLQIQFERVFGTRPDSVRELSPSGSNRRYFRLSAGAVSAIGVIGTDRKENEAFCYIASHFRGKGIAVPEIYAAGHEGMTYIQEDLGDGILYSLLEPSRKKGEYTAEDEKLLCTTISRLPDIQFKGAENLDFDKCYPQPCFDMKTVMFDLNYFKYCFLKPVGMEFNEILLQDDFENLAGELLAGDLDGFMYRDFQARNVIIRNGEPCFIDFQGGRKGPVYYDVASFIWQARARYPHELKEKMLDAYLSSLKRYAEVDEDMFRRRLRVFRLFRFLQVLGAYGFRGLWEKKPHFIGSIPSMMENVRELLAEESFSRFPYLSEILSHISDSCDFIREASDNVLEVRVCSFSYRKGIPSDWSGNGGGYVFDCRAIPNPGKLEKYRKSTGMDEDVRSYLEEDGTVYSFMDNVCGMVDRHVEKYLERGFTSLMVCFGCTGGQHRSVYCAESLAAHLVSRYPVRVRLVHREQKVDRILEGLHI